MASVVKLTPAGDHTEVAVSPSISKPLCFAIFSILGIAAHGHQTEATKRIASSKQRLFIMITVNADVKNDNQLSNLWKAICGAPMLRHVTTFQESAFMIHHDTIVYLDHQQNGAPGLVVHGNLIPRLRVHPANDLAEGQRYQSIKA